MAKSTCSVDGCDKPLRARGWCQPHWARWRVHGDVQADIPISRKRPSRPCAVADCGRAAKSHGWCVTHYERWRQTGTVQADVKIRTARYDGPCAVNGCNRRAEARGCCPAHRHRIMHWGTAAADKPIRPYDPGRDCSVPRCGRPVDARGWCAPHLRRWLKTGEVRADIPIRDRAPTIHPGTVCVADDCQRHAIAKGMCRRHWERHQRATKPWVYADAEANRRARKLRQFVEDVARAVVFERDGWLCGICGLHIDRNLAHPDPMSASVDHIIPLARGGLHAMANVQAAHLNCNVRKGSRHGDTPIGSVGG